PQVCPHPDRQSSRASLVARSFTALVPILVANRPEALVVRGHQRVTARLTAQVGMAAFQYAYSRWTEDLAVDLSDLIAEAANKVLTLGEQ
ncbi:MAG: hypothetical protein ACRDUX_05410, partial [Mycobacterium sp.]